VQSFHIVKTKILLSAALAMALTGVAFAQDLSDQFQEADAELNRVYKELRSTLNEEQKAALKKVQIAWLKEKERLVKKENTTEEQLFTEINLTIQRTEELKNGFSKSLAVSGDASGSGNSIGYSLSDREASKLLVGKWVHYQGSKYTTTYVFKSDSSYTEETDAPRYGTFNEYTGSWRIEDSRLVLNKKSQRRIEDGRVVLNKKSEQEPMIIEFKFHNRNSFTIEEENTYEREM
jgi:uncharacterized protein YecT (DUF1311 family)